MAAALLLAHALTPVAQVRPLGRLAFPTSVTGPAQDAFVRGVLALHNFEYEVAREAFRTAQTLAPGFAMAYWGEALSCVQPLWHHEDLPRARRALARLAPTAEARASRAPSERERAYLRAAEALFGEGPRAERFREFAGRLALISRAYPDDDEARAFEALAWLATIPEGTRDPAVARRAADLAVGVFARQPDHPGAAHYLLHAADAGAMTARTLEAARRYARLAPGSSHAQHMPSHVFFPLGLWDDAVAANEAAYRASSEWTRITGRPLVQRDFHSLGWLQYGYLQQGRFAKAKTALGELDRALATFGVGAGSFSPPAASSHPALREPMPSELGRGYDRLALLNERGSQRARLVIEGNDWHMMRGQTTFDNLDELFALGLSSVALDDVARADAVLRELERASAIVRDREGVETLSLMRDGLQGVLAIARADPAGGLATLAAAAEREWVRLGPVGRPSLPKPAGELYADALAGLGQAAAAMAAYERVLARIPNRPASLLGLARAARAAGRHGEAARSAQAFLATWHAADPERPELAEARRLAAAP
ncbi:MAG: hypothetical protein AB7N65_07025 [Vicinamibacterales bacterium]